MSSIEWTGQTWNPILGCSKISEGCRNCYAINQAYRNWEMGKEKVNKGRIAYYEGLTEKRSDRGNHGASDRIEWTGKVNFVPEALEIPLKRKKPTTYFVNSMSDLFHENVTDEQIDQVFAVMALTTRHTYQILTKRPERMYQYISAGAQSIRKIATARKKERNIESESFMTYSRSHPFPNVWLGTSIENQKAADDRLPWLVRTPTAVRFISFEPLLGDIIVGSDDVTLEHIETYNLDKNYSFLEDIHWAIAGAESGHNSRPMNEDWVRSLRDQCIETNTSFFYKQKATTGGKKISMPELDGKVWAEMPN